jgi:membrane-bound ClpP family serine protease
MVTGHAASVCRWAVVWLVVAATAAWAKDRAAVDPAPAARKSGQPAARQAGHSPTADDEAPRPLRRGQWIRIRLPIDNAAVLGVKRTIQHAMDALRDERPVFVLDFDVPAESAGGGRGTAFDDAHKLARFLASDELNAATTVAYIPKSLKGQAVLAALACDQIIMAPTATMGEAGIDEKVVDDTMVAAYREIAKGRNTVPTAVALGMLDKSRQVIRVTTEASTEYVTPAELADLGRQHPILSQHTIKPAGEAWQFSGAEGRKWGLVGFLAGDRRDVIRALELSPEVMEGDPAAGGAWHAVRLDLKGNVTAEKVNQLQRLIDEEVRGGANFICLWIDSPGGLPLESMALAAHLAQLDRNRVRTVAYIPGECRADAAVVAMACDQVVMGSEAVLGGPGAYQMSSKEIAGYRQTIRDSLAPEKMRSWSLWAAMIDPELAVYRATRLGDVEYFSDEECAGRQPRREQGEEGPTWEKQQRVSTPHRQLQLTGSRALEYHLANAVVESFAQLKQHYGLDNDPTLIEPGWADHLAQFLRSTEIAVLLLIVGGLALYIELHAPGVGIGGFIAVLCFALFFWSRYLEGTVGWLQVTLFLTGVVCVLLELFVLPGFGIFGLGGGVLILASLILASQMSLVPRNDYQLAQLERSLVMVATAVGGSIAAGLLVRRWLPKAPVLQHVFLCPPEGEEAEVISRREMLVDLENLAGTAGTSTTSLTPGGKARFGNHLVDVITSGEFIPRNTPVVVTEVHGNRVVVQADEAGG